MREYTVYCLGDGFRLDSVEWIRATNDDEAFRLAAKLHKGTKREIWDGPLFIGNIEIDRGPSTNTVRS